MALLGAHHILHVSRIIVNFSERKKNLFHIIKEFCTTDRIGIKKERFEMDGEGIIRNTAEIC